MHLDDFYPTPTALIDQLLEGVGSIDECGPILEPSAGKGDICDRLMSHHQGRWNRQAKPRDIDVIEIDPNLAHILRGKGYNLIHDDFLTFETYKRYGLIVANFPFSDGDQHLARALRMIERGGGKLRCLVNAETIRNPYTQLRTAVTTALDEHDAEIEYISGAFVDAERSTDVEVALIRVDVPMPRRTSVILDGLKREEPVRDTAIGPTALAETDLARSLIARFSIECEAGIRLIEEYRALTPMMLRDLPKPGHPDSSNSAIIELKVNGGNAYMLDSNDYVREVRRKYWATLLADDRISAVYTSNVLDELHNRLDELRDVDFSEYNIRQLYAELQRSVSAGVESAIIDMFDEFTRKYAWADYSSNIHYYNGWKTNKAYRVNRKIILPMNGFSAYGSKERLDSYYITRRLADMVKAFNYLAGDLASASGFAVQAVEQANEAGSFRNVDFHYFTATFYKKGTCHITFKDQRLLDKFNIYGSQRKGWLPPSYGRKTYRDMDAEERAVIDEFQGEAAYATVLRDAAYYLAEPDQLMLTA